MCQKPTTENRKWNVNSDIFIVSNAIVWLKVFVTLLDYRSLPAGSAVAMRRFTLHQTMFQWVLWTKEHLHEHQETRFPNRTLYWVLVIRLLYPGRKVFARETCPLVAGAVLLSWGTFTFFSQAVEVRMLQKLLTGQPLRRVHPQTTLNHQSQQQERGDNQGQTVWFLKRFIFLSQLWSIKQIIRLKTICQIRHDTITFMRLRVWCERFGYFCSKDS